MKLVKKQITDVIETSVNSQEWQNELTKFFTDNEELKQYMVYEAGSGVETVSIDRVNTTTTRTLIVTFISKSTGAYKHFNLTLPKYPIDQ